MLGDSGVIGLVHMEIGTVALRPWTTWQETKKEYSSTLRTAFPESCLPNDELPLHVVLTDLQAELRGTRSVVLQVLGSTEYYVGKAKERWLSVRGRHLTRLEAVGWGSAVPVEKLAGSGHLVLQCLGLKSLVVVLDRPFQVLSSKNPKNGFLCLTMTLTRLLELERENLAMDDLMELDLIWGYQYCKAWLETEEHLARQNQEDAAYLAWNVFSDLSSMTASLTAVEHGEQAARHLRKQLFMGYPRLVPWRSEVGDKRLWQYLRSH